MDKLIESRNKIKEYIIMIKPDIENSGLDFYIEELIERVLFYINRKELPETLYRTLAKS